MDTILRYFYLVLDNLAYLGILALIFLAVAALIFGLYSLAVSQISLRQRLARLMPAKTAAAPAVANSLLEPETRSIFARMTKPLHRLIVPKQGDTRKRLRLKLIRAGYRSEYALYNYVGAKLLLFLAFPAGYAMVRLFYKTTPDIILTCILLAALGFFIPDLILWGVTKSRQEQINRALPDALDLMVVCVEAGYGLDMTFKRVGEEMRVLSPELSDEFSLTNMEIRAGRPRDESFREMGLRTGLPEMQNLMTMLVQTSRFGTSLAKALRVHADAMRVKRRQIGEERAAKSAVKLVFPLVLFIFPGLLIVLAGPAFIRIYQALLPALSH